MERSKLERSKMIVDDEGMAVSRGAIGASSLHQLQLYTHKVGALDEEASTTKGIRISIGGMKKDNSIRISR